MREDSSRSHPCTRADSIKQLEYWVLISNNQIVILNKQYINYEITN